MSYLLLGSNSFAGSTFVNYLLTKQMNVIGINRSPEYHPILQPYFNHPNKSAYTFYQLDLNKNLAEIMQIIKKYKPRYIVDFAGQGMVAESWQNPEQWYTTNVLSKVKLHDVLRNCDFLERYIRVSTPEVYGNTENKMMESFQYNPSTPYAVSHAAIDMSLITFYKQYQFPVVLTRFANFYGPCQQLYRIIPRSIIYALTGKKLMLHGGGKAQRAFIHGDDVASGLEHAIQYGKSGEVYHFTSGDSISIRALVEQICQLMKVDFSALATMSEDRPGKDAKYEMEMTKTQEHLHWKPAYSLTQGLLQTISWVKENLNTIETLPLNYIHKE